MRRRWWILPLLATLGPGLATAQLVPGQSSIAMRAGPVFSTAELLRNSAVYPIPTPSGQPQKYAPVITDIKMDPGLNTGLSFSYALTRRLALEAQYDLALSVCAIRQLEIKTDTEPGDLPQYETTTLDAHVHQLALNLAYYFGPWRRTHLVLTAGVGSHSLDLLQKGEVDPDPVRDRMILAGLGLILHANERLGIRVEVRDQMYNFRFDNQFVDPVRSREILFRRPDFLLTTAPAADKFQNDISLTLSFMVQPF